MDEMEFRAASMSIRAAMNVYELMAVGLTADEARREMDRRVYGENVQYDKHGRPIEQGRGSASQPTENHFQALAKYESQEISDAARAAAIKAGTFPPKRSGAM